MKKNSIIFLRALLCTIFTFLILQNLAAQSTLAPCNLYAPLINSTFPNVTVNTSKTLGIDDFRPAVNLIDANLTNTASNASIISAGSSFIEVSTTGNNQFLGGTYTGFVLNSIGLATLLSNITITTYLAGTQRESLAGSSLLVNGITNNTSRIGFISSLSFDRVRITFTGINIINSVNVFYAEVLKFCTGPTIACNVATYLTQPDFPVIIDPVNTGITGAACALCEVNNGANVIDNNPLNFAQIIITSGVAVSGSLAVKDQISTYSSGTFAGFDIEIASLLNVNILGNSTISLLNNGVVVQSGTGISQLITVGSSILSGNQRFTLGIVSNVAFDEVKITLSNTLAVNIGTTNIYGVIIQNGCSGVVGCNGTFFLNNPLFPVVIEGSRTGINAGICVGCSVINSQNVISASNTDFARINLTAGVFASGSIAVRDLITVYPAGTTAGFVVKDPNNFIEATLLNSVTITTYLNGVQQESKSGSQLLSVSAVVVFISETNGVFYVGFTTNLPFNEVRITYSNIAGALTFLDVFSAFVDTRNIPAGTPGFLCNYTNPDFNVTFVNVLVNGNVNTNDSVQIGTVYNAAFVPVSVINPSNSMPIINADGTYTFNPSAIGVYQFLVPICIGGSCKNELLVITVLNPIGGANNFPVANLDIATTASATAVIIKSLANDAAGNSSTILLASSVTITSNPANGTAVVNTSIGDITYTPNIGFVGSDTIRYQVCDNQTPPRCASALQIITIKPLGSIINSTTAADDFAITGLNITAIGNVKINDTDAEGNVQVVNASTTAIPGKGSLTLTAEGNFVFTPVLDFFGPVDFIYTTCDNGTPSICASATIHILVRPGSVGGPLGISLINFTARENNKIVELNWQTSVEQNSKHFDIEYSKNGNQYEIIGRVMAAGNSSVTKEYSFVHNSPVNGLNYYRLKMVDIDGAFKTSDIRITRLNNSNSILVLPNPTSDRVYITNNSGGVLQSVGLFSVSGKLIQQINNFNFGKSIDLSYLEPSIYILKMIDKDGKTEIMKIIKK